MPECYGPVQNLESMLKPQWWTSVFADEWYLKTDGDVVEDPEITREEIKLLESFPFIKQILETPNCKILDLCCGQGRHSLELACQYPHAELFGHDQSAFLISVAAKRAESMTLEDGNRPVFTIGDCRSVPYESGMFDLVIVMGNSFGYFDQSESDSLVLEEIYRVLKPNGCIVLDLTNGAFMKENFAKRSWEWINETCFVCRERELAKDGKRLVSREVITDIAKGVIKDQFYQERLYTEQEIFGMLKKAGFKYSDVLLQDVTTGKELSKRQQDLGMMECRMFIQASKEDVGKRIQLDVVNELSLFTFSKLVVILGDSNLDCVGKMKNEWDRQLEIETKNKLKDAIEEIGFTRENVLYLEDHPRLFEELNKLKNESVFVFNLCDDGFQNNALHELHIPSLLELSGLKYSGAPPKTLAICYDKNVTNQIVKSMGISVPKEIWLDDPEQLQDPLIISKIEEIGFPIFNNVVENFKQLKTRVWALFNDFEEILVQEFLNGNEYSVGFIGNVDQDNFSVLPIIQVDYSKLVESNLSPILGYESKWDPTSPYWTQVEYKQADSLSLKQSKELIENCKRLAKRFKCLDYSRFDFRTDRNGIIKLLEINPNPGWCWDGKLAKMCSLKETNYSKMIQDILLASVTRWTQSDNSSIQDR
ncbi:ATP-grasp fold, sub 2 domain-containing protein [Rozella allomycis CSF55]|uniref:ATP-grasp fold, sub 2 domain-containing protein n=1 Tax=Rozella allomycis (strain CSF55) TaxID=988480 RepID=A0A075AQV8_ROZAC|nr:ATP-grasp fold, sub 2 domain-containing protein [Rozella allomycis CSF55]|eukprot:EPZ32593.1 ATP-grasp fold, sub 2 domain-containing protein [Rozella allomycis CSF55]